jgi:hypothetical protein
MFKLFGLLDIKPADGKFTTDSAKVKKHSVEIQGLLGECRTLLGPEKWSGRNLSAEPTYKQLAGFLVRMMDSLVGGSLGKTERVMENTNETVTMKDKNSKSGMRKRNKRTEIYNYELEFEKGGKSDFTALDRVEHLSRLEL